MRGVVLQTTIGRLADATRGLGVQVVRIGEYADAVFAGQIQELAARQVQQFRTASRAALQVRPSRCLHPLI
jgi:hypothetical protein